MKTILFLHHFEPYWENSLQSFNTSFEEQMENLLVFLKKNKNNVDEIVITKFESYDLNEYEFMDLKCYCDENNIRLKSFEYAYGWQRDTEEDNGFPIEELGKKWCYGTRDYHNGETDVLLLTNDVKNLKGNRIFLGGAFEGECIKDIETVFDELKIPYEKIKSLTVGTGVDFDRSDIFKIPKIKNKLKMI